MTRKQENTVLSAVAVIFVVALGGWMIAVTVEDSARQRRERAKARVIVTYDGRDHLALDGRIEAGILYFTDLDGKRHELLTAEAHVRPK